MQTTFNIDLVVIKYFGSESDIKLYNNFVDCISKFDNIRFHIHDNNINNIGLPKARNVTFGLCTNDIVCFSDFDINLKKIHWNAICSKLSDPTIGIISPITTKFSTYNPSIEWQEKDYISCNMMFLRSDVFKLIDGFDERFFVAYSDWDLIKKIQSKNLKILQHNLSFIDHYGASRFNPNKGPIWRSDFNKFVDKWGKEGVLNRKAK